MKKGIIVVSFGTSYETTRKLCIESIENRVKEHYKDFLVLRAFTSQMVIRKLKERDKIYVDNPVEALERMKAKGIEKIYIQPLHILAGGEYEKLLGQVEEFLKDNGDCSIKIGKPLLYDEEDYKKVVESLSFIDLKTDEGLVLMGHGTDHERDTSYDKLEKAFRDKGYENVYVGTLAGRVTLEDIIPKLKDKGVERVILRPFMLVAGDHVINNMASDEEDSWKSILEREGFKVELVLQGLGEVKEIQDIFLDHLERII